MNFLFQVEFGEDCDPGIELKEDAKIAVRYNGKKVYDCDYYTFEPAASTEAGISYKICVRPLNFTDPDCSVQLKITPAYFGARLHVSLTV